MSKSPFSRSELIPQEERLWVNHSKERLVVSFAKASTLQERRVAITPEGVKQLCQLGHEIIIEKDLGLHAGYDNRSYSEAGAEVTADDKRVFGSPFVVKIDPFTLEEIEKIPVGCTLLSALQIKTKEKAYFEKLLEKKITAIGLEFIREGSNHFPFVESLGEIAGQSAIHIASELLSASNKGKGLLFGSITGVPPIQTVVIGAQTTGVEAARTALSLGSDVTLYDNDLSKLRSARNNIGPNLHTSTLSQVGISKHLKTADVVIGTLTGEKRAPIVVLESMVAQMKSGSIIVDVSIDIGGCIETSELTTHDDPIRVIYDVIHYGVPNIPSRYPKTSSIALNALVVSYLLKLTSNGGVPAGFKNSQELQSGVYTYNGYLTSNFVADWFPLPFRNLSLLTL